MREERRNVIDCASRLSRLLGPSSSDESNSSTIHRKLVEKSVKLGFPKKRHYTLSDQVFLVVLMKASSSASAYPSVLYDSNKSLQTFINICKDNYQMDKNSDFLHASCLQCAILEPAVLLKVLSSEVSTYTGTNFKSFVIELLLHLLALDISRLNTTIADENGVVTIIDTIVSGIDFQVFNANSKESLLVSLLSLSRQLMEFAVNNTNLRLLANKLVILTEAIIELPASSIALKVSSYITTVLSSRLTNVAGATLVDTGNRLLREVVQENNMSLQIVITRSLRPQFKLHPEAISAALEIICQSIYDYFYYGRGHVASTGTVSVDGVLCSLPCDDLVSLCNQCADILLDSKGLLLSGLGGVRTKTYYIFIESVVMSLGIRNHDDDVESAAVTVRMLQLLGLLTKKIVCPDIADLLYPLYIDLFDSASHLAVLVAGMHNLAEFLIIYEAYFDVALELMTSSFKTCLDRQMKASDSGGSLHPIICIGSAFKDLALQCEPRQARSVALQRLLINLFVSIQTVFSSYRTSNSVVRIVRVSSVVVLEALCAFKVDNDIFSIDKHLGDLDGPLILREFRNFWFSMFLLRLNLSDDFNREWIAIEPLAQKFASTSKPFVFGRGGAGICLIEREVVYSPILDRRAIAKCGGEEKVKSLCRSSLEIDISGLELKHLLIVAVIFFLESLRIKSTLDPTHLISYILDESLSSNPTVSSVLPAVFEKLLKVWLDFAKIGLQHPQSSNACQTTILQVFSFYACHCSNNLVGIQVMSYKVVRELLVSFPWLAWQQSSVFTVLDLLEDLFSSFSSECSNASQVRRPDDIRPSYFPQTQAVLSSALKKMFVIVYSMLSTRISAAPEHTLTVLAEFLMLPHVSQNTLHMGCSVVRELVLSSKPTYHLSSRLVDGAFRVTERYEAAMEVAAKLRDDPHVGDLNAEDNFKMHITSKSQYIGETSALCKDMSFSTRIHVAQQKGNQFIKMLYTGELDAATVVPAVWRHIALLREISATPEPCERDISIMLHGQFSLLLVSVDFIYSKELIDALVEGLRWLTTTSPSIAAHSLELLATIVEDCIQNKVGIFSRSASAVQSSEDIELLSNSQTDPMCYCISSDPFPHSSLFVHMASQLNVYSDLALQSVFRCLSSSLYAINQLRNLPVDRRGLFARFHLVGVGLKLIARCITSPTCSVSVQRRRILREDIYRTAFDWFERPVFLIEASITLKQAVAAFNCLYEFLDLLRQDQKYWSIDYPDEPPSSGTSRNVMTSSSVLRQPCFAVQGQQNHNFKSSSSAKSLDRIVQSHQDESGLKNLDGGAYALLELLVLSELDHMVAWHSDAIFPDSMRPMSCRFSSKKTHVVASRFQSIARRLHNAAACVRSSWCVSPLLSLRLSERVHGPSFRDTQRGLVGRHSSAVRHIWQAAAFVAEFHRSSSNNDAAIRAANELLYFVPSPAYSVIDMLNRCDASGRERSKGKVTFRSSHSAPSVVRYVIRSLSSLSIKNLQFYLPQLIQLLRRDIFGSLIDLLTALSSRSALVCHNLVWLLQTESRAEISNKKMHATPYPRHGYCSQIIGSDPLPYRSCELLSIIMGVLNDDALEYLKTECEFFNNVTNISGKLTKVKDKEKHNQIIKNELLALGLPQGLYLPTRPDRLVVGIDVDSGAPMQSAAKCPYLLVLHTQAWGGPDTGTPMRVTDDKKSEQRSSSYSNSVGPSHLSESQDLELPGETVTTAKTDIEFLDKATKRTAKLKRGVRRWSHADLSGDRNKLSIETDACIFKVYDDCRQDALVIQVVQIFHDVFRALDLPLHLIPYSIIPNRTGADMAIGGILQVVANVKSRDQLGKAGSKTLLQYYTSNFGQPGTPSFHAAQLAFSKSLAAYAIICYFMWIKDRHNGNVLIDDAGHICHIDYGFILGISPGGNLGFENAAFKLSPEMIELLGGMNSEPFLRFVELTVRGFLVARRLVGPLVSIVSSMADSSLPCFSHKDDNLARMYDRFYPNERESEAARRMRDLVYDAANKWTTKAYDGIQKLQNNIYSDTWR